MPPLPAEAFQHQAYLTVQSHLVHYSSYLRDACSVGQLEVIVRPATVDGLHLHNSFPHVLEVLQIPLPAQKDQVKIKSEVNCSSETGGQEGLNQHHAVLDSDVLPHHRLAIDSWNFSAWDEVVVLLRQLVQGLYHPDLLFDFHLCKLPVDKLFIEEVFWLVEDRSPGKSLVGLIDGLPRRYRYCLLEESLPKVQQSRAEVGQQHVDVDGSVAGSPLADKGAQQRLGHVHKIYSGLALLLLLR